MATLSSRVTRVTRVTRLTVFAFAATSLIALGAAQTRPATGPVVAQRAVIPVNAKWPGTRPSQISISDDGQRVVYQANKGDGWKLYVQGIGEPAGKEVPGLGDNPYYGDFSPNGQWLLFGKENWIWKVPVNGGEVTKVFGGNYFKVMETDDTFVISRGANGLSRVTADGSLKREDIAAVDKTNGATTYGRPFMLPGGKGALVTVGYGTGISKRHIGVVSLPGGKLTIIPQEGAVDPRYSGSGHILYTVDNVLKAIPFDLDRLQVTGEPATIVEGVHVISNPASQFDISKNGVLVYIPGPYEVDRSWPKQLMLVDRAGREQMWTTRQGDFGAVRYSFTSPYVAVEQGTSLFIYSSLSSTWARLGGAADSNGAPVWAADGSALFYSRGRSFGRQAVDADGVWSDWKELLHNVSPQGFWGSSLSPDGAQVLGVMQVPEPEVWRLARVPVGGATSAEPLLGASTLPRRNPVLSRDGKWLAYVEKDKGSLDHVYVEPFPSGGNRLLVSEGDAAEPVWGRGLELFYRDATHMVSVRLETTPKLCVAETTRLFSTRPYPGFLNKFAATYEYHAATDRFTMSKWSIPDLPGTDIQVIKNGFEVLRSLAPPRK